MVHHKDQCWGHYFFDFINKLCYRKSNWILKFADGTKIFGSITSKKDTVSLQKELDRLIQWGRRMADDV